MKLIKNSLTIFLLIIGALTTGTVQSQRLNLPAKSPKSSITQDFALSEVSVDYSRPSKRDRKVIGGKVVPFGKLWRTGANASTKVTFGDDVTIDGKELKAGTYSLYTIPEQNQWTVIFNKNLDLWGKNGYKQEEDALRVVAKSEKLSNVVETFTIQFSSTESNSMNMDLMWENTKVSVRIVTEIESKIMKNIESTMSKDKRPYYQAASYYYENKKDLKLALTWANKALEINPKAYWTALLKAKIQKEMGDNTGAAKTAEMAVKLAKEGENEGYAKRAQDVLMKLQNKK